MPAPTSPPYPSQRRAWWGVWVFSFALVVAFTDRLILGALVDPIKQTFGVSDSAVGLVQGAAFVVIYVFAGLLLGRLADRRHRLLLLITGATVWCAGTVACGLASSFWQLAGARALVGIGEAGLGPAGMSIIVDSFPPERRGAATSVFFLGAYIGAPASIAIGGVMLGLANAGNFSRLPLLQTLAPWRAVLVLVGLFGLTVPVLLATLREPVRRGESGTQPLGAMVRRLAMDRHLLVPLYLAMGLMNVGDYGIFAWVPSVLSRGFFMAPGEAGRVFGAITAIAGGLGCALSGVISDALSARRGTPGRLLFPLTAAVIATIGAALISGASVPSVLIGLAIWVLFSSITNIGAIAALQTLVPSEYSGSGIALMAFCNVLLGLGFGPVLVPLVTDNVYRNSASVGPAIATAVVPMAIIAAMLFLYTSRVAVSRQEPA